MKYFSTKDMSKLWGISTRRITMLAGQGRIKDAKQIDGRWFIPDNAEKPVDPRKDKTPNLIKKEDHFIFPYIIAAVHSESQIRNFTKEEKDLYTLCTLAEGGHLEEARNFAEELINSENLYVKLGALYSLPAICMYLSDFMAAEKYSLMFRTEMQNTNNHKAELDVLLNAFNGELQSLGGFMNAVDSYNISLCSEDLLPCIAVHKLLADINRYTEHGTKPDTAEHELVCRMIESNGYFFCSLMMHFYLSICYSIIENKSLEHSHLEAVIKIGLSHNLLFTLSYYMAFNPETSIKVLNKYPPELSSHVKELGEVVIKSRNEYFTFRNNSSILSKLTADDYIVISRCIKKYSVREMAEEFGLSESGMKKRLSMLYSKLGVRTKQELSKVYFHYAMDWEAPSQRCIRNAEN